MTSSPVTPTTPGISGSDPQTDPDAAVNAAPDTTSDDPTPKPLPKYQAPGPVPARPVHPMPASFPELYSLPTETRLPQPPQMVPSTPMPAVSLPNPHEIYDGHSSYSPEHLVCVRCGSSNLAQGQVIDHGDRFRDIMFAPKRVTLRWLNSVLAVMPFRSVARMNAIACRNCGLVQLTVDPGELRRVERRRD